MGAVTVAIAVAVTYTPEAFDQRGNHSNEADILFCKIGARWYRTMHHR
ncbi:lipoprotein LpqK [Mycobacterium haemophilum DSM 44634]